MRSILGRFTASMLRAYEDFHVGCLALVFIDQRPFSTAAVLPVPLTKNTIPPAWLNDFRSDQRDEYEGALLRHLLNDMVLAYERYATTMYLSHVSGRALTDPALSGNRGLNPSRFEALAGVYTEPDREFTTQLRHLRNSVVHYNGLYNSSNRLDYAFGTQRFCSVGREGTPIESSDFNVNLWIWNTLQALVGGVDERYFAHYR